MVEGEEGAEEPRGPGEGGTLGLQPSQCGAPGSRRALRAGVGSHGEAWVHTGGRLSLVWPQSGELSCHETLRGAAESRAAPQHATQYSPGPERLTQQQQEARRGLLLTGRRGSYMCRARTPPSLLHMSDFLSLSHSLSPSLSLSLSLSLSTSLRTLPLGQCLRQ